MAGTPPHGVRGILRRWAGTTSPIGSGRTQHGSETKDDPKSAAWLSLEVRQRYRDITYIRLRGGWMYLVAVLDWFSRYIVSWELDQSLAQPFVMAAVQRALAHAIPAIWNSDQGSHFTSLQYTSVLLAAGVQISMDGKGRALDNIFVERLWRSVKYEEVYLHDYANPREARAGLTQYLWDYNHTRPHQALAYRTPAEVYD